MEDFGQRGKCCLLWGILATLGHQMIWEQSLTLNTATSTLEYESVT